MMLADYCTKIIRFSFYALFFLVPLVFTSSTSELFELNKMWLTWGLTVIIVGVWIIRMIVERKVFIRRTPLDIPLVLFLLSQIISTIFSLDSRVSLWGYYSRFNGGLLSILSYTLLYYAFVSNDTYQEVRRFIKITVVSGIVVALWGFPSHFGYDPTCLMFRGTFDTSCWTESFRPTIRIFSTLGQPAWMAAYLAVLIPITTALLLKNSFITVKEHLQIVNLKIPLTKKQLLLIVGYASLVILFYLDLLFANTRGGFLAFWAANSIFWLTLFMLKVFSRKRILQYALILNLVFFLCNFLIGTPVSQLDKFTLKSLQAPRPVTTTAPQTASNAAATTSEIIDTGITDSGDIRLLVWQGAIDAWKQKPIFGTGVETFAFAYYATRPAAHNMTSEWDYLYNKAHNEYLNYLTTTGAVGLGTHLLLLAGFLFLALRYFFSLRKVKDQPTEKGELLLLAALPGAFVSIIISNFFGFSVVIINIFLFFIPLWFFLLSGKISDNKGYTFFLGKHHNRGMDAYQWSGVLAISLTILICLYQLIVFWVADTAYALGYNYDRAGAFDTAYPHLAKAATVRPAEPVFKDELSINLATLATAFVQNNDATTGAQLAQQALGLTKEVTQKHPNNVVFWKSSVRVYYLLAQIDQRYYQDALKAILKAQELAPTDAKIGYNVGVMYGHNGQFDKGIEALTKTVEMKPNYRDAYYARALFYRQLAEQAIGTEKVENQNKANDDLEYILTRIDPTDDEVRKLLESWGVSR